MWIYWSKFTKRELRNAAKFAFAYEWNLTKSVTLYPVCVQCFPSRLTKTRLLFCWMCVCVCQKADERPSFTELSLMIMDELEEADGPASWALIGRSDAPIQWWAHDTWTRHLIPPKSLYLWLCSLQWLSQSECVLICCKASNKPQTSVDGVRVTELTHCFLHSFQSSIHEHWS